jgi:hypothetical protein
LEVLAGGVQNEVRAFLHYCRALYSGSHVSWASILLSCTHSYLALALVL